MPVRSRVKVLLYEWNLERVRAGDKPLSLHGLAKATGLAPSALRKLANNESGRVDFETLDRLMRFFGTNDLRDLLEYRPDHAP